MSPEAAERKLAAILSADVVGYSRLMAEDEAETVHILGDYREQVDLLVRQHRGRLVDFTGDNFLAEFPTALDSVQAAVEIQRVLAGRNAELPAERKMEFRIGIHLGDIRVEGERIFGDGVNIAARLESLAAPGGVCISATVHEQVRNKLQVGYDDLGDQTVKNIPDQVHVYQVRLDGPKISAVRAAAPARRSTRGIAIAAGAVLVVAGLVALWWGSPRFAPSSAGSQQIRSLAVLPLDNLSGDPGQEYFADGMTEALIGSLARIKGLRVISRTSSMTYKNSDRTLPQIARELKVDAVVEGSVLRAGDRVRITTQLIRGDSDEHLWSESYERDLKDVLALQSEVAKAIAEQIELKLGPGQQPDRVRPVDPEAFEAYLKGRHHWNRRTGADLRKSIEYFETAIALDPDWALAHSGLAQAYVLLAVYEQEVQPRTSMPRARAAAERALELVDELAPAHAALAAVRLWYDWDWAGAEAGFQRALELDPSYATAHHWYSIHQVLMKQPDAVEHAQRAQELDPLSTVIGANLGIVQLFTRDYDRSIEALRSTLEFAPGFAFGEEWLISAYIAKGMHEEAVEGAERLTRTHPDHPGRRVFLAHAYAGAGRNADARRILAEVRDAAVDLVTVASAYAALGDANAAFEWLEKAFERRSLRLSWIRVDPGVDPLRSDPRFQDLLRRIGFPES